MCHGPLAWGRACADAVANDDFAIRSFAYLRCGTCVVMRRRSWRTRKSSTCSANGGARARCATCASRGSSRKSSMPLPARLHTWSATWPQGRSANGSGTTVLVADETRRRPTPRACLLMAFRWPARACQACPQPTLPLGLCQRLCQPGEAPP